MNKDERTWPEPLQQTYAAWVNTVGEEGVRKDKLYIETSDQHRSSGHHFFVDCIGVLDTHRGNGYAKALLQYCFYLSNANPVSDGVALDTEAAKNVAFYQRLGYELKGESDIEGMQCWHFFKPNN
jgi:ribosomal protein S18 acetylase RimI-like enzyme